MNGRPLLRINNEHSLNEVYERRRVVAIRGKLRAANNAKVRAFDNVLCVALEGAFEGRVIVRHRVECCAEREDVCPLIDGSVARNIKLHNAPKGTSSIMRELVYTTASFGTELCICQRLTSSGALYGIEQFCAASS